MHPYPRAHAEHTYFIPYARSTNTHLQTDVTSYPHTHPRILRCTYMFARTGMHTTINRHTPTYILMDYVVGITNENDWKNQKYYFLKSPLSQLLPFLLDAIFAAPNRRAALIVVPVCTTNT